MDVTLRPVLAYALRYRQADRPDGLSQEGAVLLHTMDQFSASQRRRPFVTIGFEPFIMRFETQSEAQSIALLLFGWLF